MKRKMNERANRVVQALARAEEALADHREAMRDDGEGPDGDPRPQERAEEEAWSAYCDALDELDAALWGPAP